ncbi:helix-turn-helix domain-containing protein [Paenibacillus koleovorans]|uniref:helix-turn-helix domain-containing protein n=1 Tax=Paenibacillus koleovorans TaxID=121608 RepID=UPI000FD75D17|nr:helix-turn-helix transcriptional regulator [Paenibacillus koleovorans]
MSWDDFVDNELDYKSNVEKEAIKQMAILVNAIIRRRKQLGLSQKDIANRTGMTQSQIARLESQSSVPRMETLLKVAIALGMNIGLEEAATRALGS